MPLENWQEVEVTIASGAAVSGAFNVNGQIIAIITPSTWTAADIGIDGWITGTTYAPVYRQSATQTSALFRLTNIATSAAGIYGVPSGEALAGLKKAKLTSINTASAAAANQSGDRTLRVRFKPDNT